MIKKKKKKLSSFYSKHLVLFVEQCRTSHGLDFLKHGTSVNQDEKHLQ